MRNFIFKRSINGCKVSTWIMKNIIWRRSYRLNQEECYIITKKVIKDNKEALERLADK